MKKTINNRTIREILNAPTLTDEQCARAFGSAASDAELYLNEDELPDIGDMEIDWWIDPDIREAGVNGYGMQALSFAIVRATRS